MVKEQLQQAIARALKEIGFLDVPVVVEKPMDPSHGDYSSNVALIAAKKVGKNPMELALNIIERIKNHESRIMGIEKVEIVKPGFINFWLSQEYLINQAQDLADGSKEPKGPEEPKGNKVMVEFTDPNPFKEFHIGHLYSNTVGESISRLLESQANEVKRVCYQGDVGLHVAKSLFGILQITNYQLLITNLENESLEARAKFLGEAYAAGAKAYEESTKSKEAINRINKQVYENDPEIMPLYIKGREWSLEYFETIYKRLGTKFWRYYFESEAGDIGIKIVKENIGKVFEESDGAVIFKAEQYGLHTRVFINSLGLPTYEAKELGLAPTKYKDYPYDRSIIVTGNEINSYFKVLLKALSLIYPDLAAKTKHVGHGMVRLPQGKMSSRTGNVITGEWLLDEAKTKIQKAYPDMDSSTSEIVAVGAVKYALLKASIGRDVTFDFDESISLQGNSGPYLQYTYARTQSVLNKSQESNNKSQINFKFQISNFKLEPEEVILLRLLAQFEELIQKAASELQPHIVAGYLFDLAQSFNLFYQKHKIVGSNQENFRLMLTSATGNVLKRGLDLLGIKSPEKM